MDNDFSNVKLALFDFDGVFTDNNVYITENGKEIVKCNRSDGIGISRIKKIGIKCYVISSEKNIVVEKRCQKLNINFKQNVLDKKIAVLDICKENNIEPENTLFLGNDINDIPALKSVGFPVAVADAFLEIEEFVKFKTKAKGGQGAVREVCDIIFRSKK
tara:strand:+ start:32 stop:511 length:480 start_codon:yes stop_codon:yes gene_type:complete